MREERSGSNLPALISPDSRRTQPASYNAPPMYFGDSDPETPAVPLAHYFGVVRRHKWRILAFIFVCVLLTYIASKRQTPSYESTATVEIDWQAPQGVMGIESGRTMTSDPGEKLASALKLIQSDTVLRPVAEKYRLLDSKTIKDKAKAEKIWAATVFLPGLRVVHPPYTHLLLITYRSADPALSAAVANEVGQSYIRTTSEMKVRTSTTLSSYMEKHLDQLKAKMERSRAALAAFERDLSVVNPEQRTGIISARLMQLNSEYTAAQTDRVRKEAAYESVKSGTLEAAQVSTQGESLKGLSERLSQAEENFADIKSRFGTNYPEYKKAAAVVGELQRQIDTAKLRTMQRVEVEYRQAADREHMLQKAVAESKAEFDRMNARSIEYQSAKSEADADRRFYDELVHKVEEAGINAAFQNAAIRLADLARPSLTPVAPNVVLNVMFVLLFSTILAIGAAVVSDMLDNSIHDGEYIQRALKIPVLGMLPIVKAKRVNTLVAPAGRSTNGNLGLMRLSQTQMSDDADVRVTGYVEAIRTLRNSILLGSLDSQLHSILITSAGPREGKTTTAVHLALAHAEQRHKTLLIDCDLRRPGLHTYFDIGNERGLTTIVTENAPWQNMVVTVSGVPDLDILPSGPASRRAADLIARPVSQILDEAAKFYDLVIIDAPPMLGFAESLQLATLVDGVVVIALSGETTRKAMSATIHTLKRVSASVIGVVLNKTSNGVLNAEYYKVS